MLYIVNETTFNGYSVYNLDLLHIIAILFGIFVIISKNPIVSVLFLIGLFLSISGYLILTGLNFIGLAYLLVYIGAVSILFLFILMLINVRISELLIDSINSIPLAILVGSFFNYSVNNVLPYMVMTNSLFFNFSIKKKLTNVTSVSWDGYLSETSHITAIGNILYGNFSIWLIITSIILLLAMVGCIVITLKEKTSKIELWARPHQFNNLTLKSSFGFFTTFKVFLLKLKLLSGILLSRSYLKHLIRKLFTKKSLLIVVSSIIIGNLVRYFFIKYGIDTPLLNHPVLFTSAAGISSFLSIFSKLMIETAFGIFSDPELALSVGEGETLSITNGPETTLKMVNGNKEGVVPDTKSTSPNDSPFKNIDDLVNKLKSQIQNVKNEKYAETCDELKNLNDKLNNWEAFCNIDLTKKLFPLNEFNKYFTKSEMEELETLVGTMSKGTNAFSEYIKMEDYIRIQKNLANRSMDQYNRMTSLYKSIIPRVEESRQPILSSLVHDIHKDIHFKLETKKSMLNSMMDKSKILEELKKNKK